MKNKILIGLTLVFMMGCQNDDYVALGDFSDVSWYTTIHPGDEYIKATSEYISFMDVSQNALSHTWTIEEGNSFLKAGFSASDTLLTRFINPDLGLTTTDKTVHVLFQNEGINTVKLRNVFKEKVTFQSENGPIDAVQEDDVWVFENSFEIDVVAKEIKPAYKILQDDVEILRVNESDIISINDADTWPIIDVEVSKTLTFVDLTTIGRPNDRTWYISSASSVTKDSIAEVSFLNYGTTQNIGSFTSARVSPLPNRSSNKLIPLRVRVVASDEPFNILGEITEDESEVISFKVAGIVDQASIIGQANSFTVNVSNVATGFNQNISVQSIEVDSEDNTILKLTLSEPIYNSDIVTVAYNGGTIKSTDERDLNNFGPEVVEMHSIKMLDVEIFGAEGIGTDRSGIQTFYGRGEGWYGDGGRSEERAASGVASFKWSVPNWTGDSQNIEGVEDHFTADPGTYILSLKVFMPTGSDITSMRTILRTAWQPISWDFTGIAKDTWVYLEKEITITAQQLRMIIQINGGSTGAQTMYIDDLQLAPVEVRQ